MDRKSLLCVGVVIAGAMPCAAAAIPVGPEGPSHYPVAVNNEGDVLFRVYTDGPPYTQTELYRVDGTMVRYTDPGWFDVEPRGLGPNGEVVLGLGYLDHDHPSPWGGTPEFFEHELVRPDGSRARVDSVDTINYVYGVAPDGRVLGIAQGTWDFTDDLPVQGFIWDALTGVTLLEHPHSTSRNWAFYGARDGGYIGFANDGLSGTIRKAVWWNTDGTIASTFDLDLLHAVGIEEFAQAGVLADGTLVGHDFDGNVGGTTVLTISPSGGISTIPMDVGMKVDFTDVNADGLIVGRRFSQGPEYTTADWMIWSLDGVGFPLDRFLPSELHRSVGQVIDINDNGDVLVLTSDIDGGYLDQTYLITDLPAPGAASALVCAGAIGGTRRRRRLAFGAAAACLAGAASGASAVTITPVGPEGRSHDPVALNERGDVLFDANWGEPYNWEAGHVLSGPELWRADGTVEQYTAPGAEFGNGASLAEDGSVVGYFAYRFPGPEGIDTFKWGAAAYTSAGAEVVYHGSSAFGHFEAVTPEGTFLGFGSDYAFRNPDTGSIISIRPIAWDSARGETALALPPGMMGGMAYLSNPAGGYVGWTYSESGSEAMAWWSEAGDVIGNFDLDPLLRDGYSCVGVRYDGAILGSVNGRLTAFYPDGTMNGFGEPSDGILQLSSVNSAGFSVGELWTVPPEKVTIRAMAWLPDGTAIDLQGLLPADSPWRITDAVDITEAGDILVHASLSDDSGYGQAFIIHGIPAPGAGSVAIGVGAMTGARRRRRRLAFGAAAACLAGAASGASAVTITPVGPEGLTYSPSGMNDRGDVVFHDNWGLLGWNPGEMTAGAVLMNADGSVREFRLPGAESSYAKVGADGSVVVQYSYRFPPGDFYGTPGYNTRVYGPDGAEIVYHGAFPFAHTRNVAPDGTFLGYGSTEEFTTGYEPPLDHVPIAWRADGSETVLPLPAGATYGDALFWNPTGGCVGFVSDDANSDRYVWWNESGEITGGFDFHTLTASGWPDTYNFAGIRADGVMIGCLDNRLMEFRPDGIMAPYGDAFDRDIILIDANSQGMSVGILLDLVGPSFDITPMLFTVDGHAIDLQSLMPEDSPWTITDVQDITEGGDILVHAWLKTDSKIGQAFIIHGIPAPGAGSVAIGFGAMVMVMRPARKRSA